jgi:hypothetical protein
MQEMTLIQAKTIIRAAIGKALEEDIDFNVSVTSKRVVKYTVSLPSGMDAIKRLKAITALKKLGNNIDWR